MIRGRGGKVFLRTSIFFETPEPGPRRPQATLFVASDRAELYNATAAELGARGACWTDNGVGEVDGMATKPGTEESGG
jgi:hypothetical protein